MTWLKLRKLKASQSTERTSRNPIRGDANEAWTGNRKYGSRANAGDLVSPPFISRNLHSLSNAGVPSRGILSISLTKQSDVNSATFPIKFRTPNEFGRLESDLLTKGVKIGSLDLRSSLNQLLGFYSLAQRPTAIRLPMVIYSQVHGDLSTIQ